MLVRSPKQSVVLLGYGDLPSAPREWALIAVPETVVPTSESLADKLRATRVSAGLPAEEPESVDSSLPVEIRERISAQLATRREFHRQIRVVEDPQGNPPACLNNGAHFVATQALSAWQGLILSKPTIAHNWGQR